MVPVYVSNGTFITRYNGRDYHLIDRYGVLLAADGIEFLMYNCWKDDVPALRRFLTDTGLSFPVTHVDKEFGELLSVNGLSGREDALHLLERDAETAGRIGSKKLVVHMYNGLNSDRNFDVCAPMITDMYCLCTRAGLELTIENVTCVSNLALSHMETLVGLCPGIHFTFDTKMAYLHGENELLGTERWNYLLKEGFISHLHLNDTRETTEKRLPILHIGEGKVDFPSFFSLLSRYHFSGTATVESTTVAPDGSVDMEKLNRTIHAVKQGLNGQTAS